MTEPRPVAPPCNRSWIFFMVFATETIQNRFVAGTIDSFYLLGKIG